MNFFNNIYFIKFFPFLISCLCFLLMILPIMPNRMGEITPMFGVIALCFWIIYTRDLIPYMAAFIIGLLHDILIGTMFGIGSLAAMVLRIVIVRITKNDSNVSFLKSFLIINMCLFIWTLIIASPVLIKSTLLISYIPIIFQLFCSMMFSPILIIIFSFFLRKMEQHSYD